MIISFQSSTIVAKTRISIFQNQINDFTTILTFFHLIWIPTFKILAQNVEWDMRSVILSSSIKDRGKRIH